MAIYHLNVSTGSRGGGQSAAAKCDYIEREGKYAKGKDELLHSESGNMPEFAAENPREYWQAADEFERANGRLFRQVEFALPAELSDAEKIQLAHDFAASITDAERLPFTLAIHKGEFDHQGRKTDAPANPHVHLIISERANDGIERTAEQWFKRANKKNPENGGAAKTKSLESKEWLEAIRERWADMANEALERGGHDARIDHRTLAEQGIDRIPQIHKGAADHMSKRGIETERMAQAVIIAEDNKSLSVMSREHAKLEAEAERLEKVIKEVGEAPAVKTKTEDTDAHIAEWLRHHEAMPLLALSCKYKEYGETYESNQREISHCDRREKEITQNISTYQKHANEAQRNIEQLERGIFGRWRNKGAIAEQERERDSYQKLIADGCKELEALPARREQARENIQALSVLIPLVGEVLRDKAEKARQMALNALPAGVRERWQEWKSNAEAIRYRHRFDEHKHQEHLDRLFNQFKRDPTKPPPHQEKRSQNQSRGMSR